MADSVAGSDYQDGMMMDFGDEDAVLPGAVTGVSTSPIEGVPVGYGHAQDDAEVHEINLS
jgi:hypothetical protein